MRNKDTHFFELSCPLVRFDHVARIILNANRGVPIRLAKLARFFQTLRMKKTILPLRNLTNRSPLRAFLLIALALGCFGLSPQARGVCQEGCLTNANTVLGDDALFSLTTGFDNTAIGFNALYFNTTGSWNTATGVSALDSNTTGYNNTANGVSALVSNTTGGRNTANGAYALQANTTGFTNTATGFYALFRNTTGANNTANGQKAMHDNTTGSFNIALGENAGVNLTTGSNNIEIGNRGLVKPRQFVSASKERRLPPTSPGSVGQPFQPV
jgi:hypothetical protein